MGGPVPTEARALTGPRASKLALSKHRTALSLLLHRTRTPHRTEFIINKGPHGP